MRNKTEKTPRILLLEVRSINDFPESFHKFYHTHLLCHKGHITFLFNDEKLKCNTSEFLFWFVDSKLSDLRFSKSFRASVLLVEKTFLNDNIPDQSWSINALLHSRKFPIKHLENPKHREKIISNFHQINSLYQETNHLFYEEILRLQMRVFILEMWHIFSAEYEKRKHSLQTGSLYERFMMLLEQYCLQKREVQFYAEQLYITPKYLNHICKTSSDITASQWIQKFARERIELLLQNKQFTIAEIADSMEFSSRSFFTRYVKKVLGVTPSAYRNRLR